MPQQYVAPILIDCLPRPSQTTRLKRLSRAAASDRVRYTEELIQGLVDLDPPILPIEDIEPAFAGLRPVCRELPLGPAGNENFADNLLVNPDGRICLVECKLWRNGGSIREVIGQLLDYGSRLATLTYDGLVQQVRTALKCNEGDPIAEKVLGAAAAEDDRLVFADRVERSLRRGDFLLLIVGDHIRPDVKRIADLLQNHATLGFALGLIEMAIYGDAEGKGPYYVQPRLLLSTEVITRTVLLTGGGATSPAITKVELPSKPQTLSEKEFFSKLKETDPAYPERIQHLLDRCRELGCEPELLRKYNIYLDDPAGGRMNLGAIGTDGRVEIWAAGRDKALNEAVGVAYMRRVVSMLPNASLKEEFANPASWHVGYEKKGSIPLREMLAHEEEWLKVIGDVTVRLREIEQSRTAN